MPGDDESENAGDDSDSGKEAGEMEDQDEDELAAGVTAPPDVMAAHHEDDVRMRGMTWMERIPIAVRVWPAAAWRTST